MVDFFVGKSKLQKNFMKKKWSFLAKHSKHLGVMQQVIVSKKQLMFRKTMLIHY
tara:strand:- start:7 stop:168 length:162 start_codon:yes stop_codon:yes gene_type:complete